ncbi:hypothetical protein LCGC14_2177360 [marine sediment metagenome]|uniref:Uncharacterized protein n=1 Tax=marine sediment metagenome TaxID=412755 RepID=A0A0F9EAI6_9ZZZZ
MYYMFHVYVCRDDGRIWKEPITINAGVQQSAEKTVRNHYEDMDILHFELKLKSDIHDDPRFEKHNLIWAHDGIVSIGKLKSLGIDIPENQSKPFIYPDGKTVKEILAESEEIEEREIEEYVPKYKSINCEWCKQQVPKNGAAQFSHLKKHLSELVASGAMTKKKAKDIRSIKLDSKTKKIFLREFG